MTIELVPSTSWYTNLRSILSRKEWDAIRNKCYAEANHKCEICGADNKIECHEKWQYNDELKTQTLIGLIALCPTCHMVKHAGRTIAIGKEYVVLRQLMKINNMTKAESINYIDEQFKVWNIRSNYDWEQDISYIETYLS